MDKEEIQEEGQKFFQIFDTFFTFWKKGAFSAAP